MADQGKGFGSFGDVGPGNGGADIVGCFKPALGRDFPECELRGIGAPLSHPVMLSFMCYPFPVIALFAGIFSLSI